MLPFLCLLRSSGSEKGSMGGGRGREKDVIEEELGKELEVMDVHEKGKTADSLKLEEGGQKAKSNHSNEKEYKEGSEAFLETKNRKEGKGSCWVVEKTRGGQQNVKMGGGDRRGIS